MTTQQMFKYHELEEQLSGDLIQKISAFSTVFYFTDTIESFLTPCGSGTFVRVANERLILTASHVIDYIKQKDIIGISIGNSAPTYKIETKYLEFHQKGAKPYTKDGPDLGIIRIPSKFWGDIEARKVFFNIEINSEDVFSTYKAADYSRQCDTA